MMHTVVKSHRSGRDVVPKKFVDEICGVLQDADIGLRKYANIGVQGVQTR